MSRLPGWLSSSWLLSAGRWQPLADTARTIETATVLTPLGKIIHFRSGSIGDAAVVLGPAVSVLRDALDHLGRGRRSRAADGRHRHHGYRSFSIRRTSPMGAGAPRPASGTARA